MVVFPMKFFSLLLCVLPLIGCEDPLLRTVKQGQLRGTTRISRKGRDIYSFMKIPYAKQPLGELRFKKPEKAEGWTGVRDATSDDGIVCATRNIYVKGMFKFKGQEDCLYLNVYTPSKSSEDGTLLPVMVYIHGGGWISGSGNSFYYPPDYLLDNDVVLVGFNYRLGAAGFLSTEDDFLPGNWGLKDQNLALQWIQENIRNFGGDPNSVTIFGESAGGSSVHYHMFSPMSKGLFHKAISQSGTAFTPWSMAQPRTARENTFKLARALNCSVDYKEMLACLRKQPIQRIVEQDVIFMEWITDPMIPFKPVVEEWTLDEDPFLPESPEEALKGGRVANVPWMTGFTSGDGALRVSSIFDNATLVKELDEQFTDIIPMSLFLRGKTENDADLATKIRKFYFGTEAISEENYMNVTNLYTDGWFGFGTHEAVRLHHLHTRSPIFYYYFAYRGDLSFSSAFGDTTRDYQVSHGDDLIYLFPMLKDFPHHKFSQEDDAMIDQLTRQWTNFARTGDPSPAGEVWEPTHSENLEYLGVDKTGNKMGTNLLETRFNFWTGLNLPIRLRQARSNGVTMKVQSVILYLCLLKIFL